MTTPNNISYVLMKKNRGKLKEPVVFETGIIGYKGKVKNASISVDGTCLVEPGFLWDFGSGPAVDTPDVVIASLAHDALCRIHVECKLNSKFRRKADAYFRKVLKDLGMGWFRRWYFWTAVRFYSVTST